MVEELGPEHAVLGIDRVGLEDFFLLAREGGVLERLRQVLGVAAPSSKWTIRQPLWLVQSLVAAGFALMSIAWGGVEALENMAIAWLVAGAWSTGLDLVA